MVLNSWQKLDRVLQGRPFGDGANGSATISADPNIRATALGTIATTALTAGSTAFANGDIVLIIQYQFAGRGQFEINKVASGGGTVNLVMSQNLQYNYVAGAQIVRIPRYTTLTINAYTPPIWNGSINGITIVAAKTSILTGGTFSGTGRGFRGGAPVDGTTLGGEGGNGNGDRTYGAAAGISSEGGSGGGYGTNGQQAGTGANAFGLAYGNADLTIITAGGSGGGSSGSPVGSQGAGGGSGHLLILIGKVITISNPFLSRGGNGGNGADRAGGGGSGGGVLLVCGSAAVGSNNITATGGAKGIGIDANANGGDGGVGRIAIHHSGVVTGTTNPSFFDQSDPGLKESVGGGFLKALL